jgi:hypothetical protein
MIACAPPSTFLQTRYPELVSGFIALHSRSAMPQARFAAGLPNITSVRAEKWTLKQVQGDEEMSKP